MVVGVCGYWECVGIGSVLHVGVWGCVGSGSVCRQGVRCM